MSIKYPFKTGLVDEATLRDWVAMTVYSETYAGGRSGKKAANDRVRQRINYHRESPRLRRALVKQKINAKEFFTWACGQQGWVILLTIKSLPRHVDVSISSPEAMRGQAGEIPLNVEELQKGLISCKSDLSAKADHVRYLEAQISLLRKKLSADT